MIQTPTKVRWRTKGFLRRLLVSYFLIPLVPPILLLLRTRGFGHMALADWVGIVALYYALGFAAIILLGTPLLVGYIRLGWTGFLSFMAGGGICAAATTYVALHGNWNLGLIQVFTVAGIISGGLFRLILFGVSRHPYTDTDS
jgi:hypothetical protein